MDFQKLDKIKEETLNIIKVKNKKYRILVGMATCGMAAGATSVLNELNSEIKAKNINDVDVVSTGCIGICKLEPIVEIVNSDGESTKYVEVTPAKIKEIVSEHIINNNICREYVY